MHVFSQVKLAQSSHLSRRVGSYRATIRGVLRRLPNGENLLPQQRGEDHGVKEGGGGQRDA